VKSESEADEQSENLKSNARRTLLGVKSTVFLTKGLRQKIMPACKQTKHPSSFFTLAFCFVL
jgi:hypothetical protein